MKICIVHSAEGQVAIIMDPVTASNIGSCVMSAFDSEIAELGDSQAIQDYFRAVGTALELGQQACLRQDGEHDAPRGAHLLEFEDGLKHA